MSSSAHTEVASWLERFAACVRERRYTDARKLFSEHVVGFGTTARRVTDLDELELRQWRPIWEASKDFHFELAELRTFDGEHVLVAAVPFRSVGYDASSMPYSRPGRATLVLAQTSEGLMAVHSHFSLDPGVPTKTHAPRNESE